MEAVPSVAPTPLPDTFSIGTPLDGPDGLFHAVAQALNNYFKTNEFTVESLRETCSAYANDKRKNEWIVHLFGQGHAAEFLHYTDNIQYSTAAKKHYEVISGRVDLDARILSEVFGVNIHFTDSHQNKHTVLTKNGTYQVIDPLLVNWEVNWNAPETIYISATTNGIFCPLLKPPLIAMHREAPRPPSQVGAVVMEELYPAATRQSHGSLFSTLAVAINKTEEEIKFQCYDYMRNLDEKTTDLMQQVSGEMRYIQKRAKDWGFAGRFAPGSLLTKVTGEYTDAYRDEFSKKLNWIKDQLDEDYLNYPGDISSNPNYNGRLNVDGVIFCTVFNKRLIIRTLNDKDEPIKTTVVTKDGCIENVLDAEKFRDANTITLQVKNGQYQFVNRNVGDTILEYAQTVDGESEVEEKTDAIRNNNPKLAILTSEPDILIEVVTKKELKDSKKLFEDNKPSGFVVTPQTKNDAFLGPLAHGLNNIIHGTSIVIKEDNLEHSEASLREKLRVFAQALNPNNEQKHRLIAINNARHENGHRFYCENININYINKDNNGHAPAQHPNYIPGDLERDGPALSEELGVDIHIMVTRDVTDNNGKTHKIIVKHLLCNKDGCREVEIEDINWKSEKVVTLVTDEKMEKFDPVDSHLPRTIEFKIINGVVHIFMGGVLLYALIPQGMAGFVVARAMPNAAWLSNPFSATLTMIGSIAGKFGLFMSWNAKQWFGFPSAYNNIAHFFYNISPHLENFVNSVDNSTWTWENDLLPFFAKVGAGSVAASFFGFLAIPTNTSFAADIINNPTVFGPGFQAFAQFSQSQGPLITFIIASAIGNFFSGPGMFNAATGAAGSLYTDYQKARDNPDPHALKRFWAGAGIGAILAVAGCIGFINFGPLAVNTIYKPLFEIGPLGIAVGSLYTAGIVTALFSIAFANGMPLGRKITERIMDICKQEDIPYGPDIIGYVGDNGEVFNTNDIADANRKMIGTVGADGVVHDLSGKMIGRAAVLPGSNAYGLENNYKGFFAWWDGTTTAQKTRFWIAVGTALVMVLVGGTPNVFQALYENEGAVLAVFALAASALAEYQGTEELVETLLSKAAEFAAWCNAQRNGASQKPAAPEKEKSYAENSRHTIFSRPPPPRGGDDPYSIPLYDTATDNEGSGSHLTAEQLAAAKKLGEALLRSGNNSGSSSGEDSSSEESPRSPIPSMRPGYVVDF